MRGEETIFSHTVVDARDISLKDLRSIRDEPVVAENDRRFAATVAW